MNAAGIPGEVHCHEWVNFGHNREQALQYAYRCGQADWVLLIDADEQLAYSDPLFYRRLEPGTSYSLEKRHGELRYRLTNLVDIRHTQWQWRGVVHEYLHYAGGSEKRAALPQAWIIYHEGEGVRSRGVSAEEKFLNDARLLEAELQKHPDDARSRFYLAQSYNDAGLMPEAYENYLLRAGMSGWAEENFVAQYRAGKLAVRLNKPYGEIAATLLKAYEMRPGRGAEPLHELAAYCRIKSWYAQGYLFSQMGAQIAYPGDILFVESEIYQWKIHDELAIAAYWTGRYEECKAACERILALHIAPHHAQRIKKNLDFAVQKLAGNG
jgi:hypothetical protein